MRIQKVLPGVLGVVATILLLGGSVLAQPNATDAAPVKLRSARTGLHYQTFGEGEPILALHGLGGSLYTWRKLIAPPYRFPGYKLIMVDLRGAGDSPKPKDKHYSIVEQADLIYQFIQEQNLTNLTLLGNSYGGAVSLLVAIRLCEEPNCRRLSKLILLGSGGYDKDLPSHLRILRTPMIGWLAVHLLPPTCQASKVLHDSYEDDEKISDEQIAEYARPIGLGGGRHALLETGKQAIPEHIDEVTAKYPKIKVPTLILWGLDDEIIPIKIGRMLHEAIRGSRLEIINNCGHVPQEECPEETICYISEFLGLPFRPCPK